jgi:protocatechuate 3,4-dioxygenase beta subunit
MNNNILKSLAITIGIIILIGGSIYAGYMVIKSGISSDKMTNDIFRTKSTNSQPKPGGLDPREDVVTTRLPAEQKNNCSTLTPQVTSGPFYVSNIPELLDDNLNFTNLDGMNMYLEGYVYGGTDDTTPLVGAKIEIWQADNEGKYHPQSNGDYNTIDKGKVALRGYTTTDDQGTYSYTSIFPAEYEGRTRHVHYRVSKEGYETLTTQLTFYKDGDKYSPESDNVAQQLLDCQNIKNLIPIDGIYNSSFDFRLKKI